jgi:hypothetical protein
VEEEDAMDEWKARLDVFWKVGSDYHVNWKVTRLPILACSRLHVYIGAIRQKITGVVEFE